MSDFSPAIETAQLFGPLLRQLVELLRRLEPDQWDLGTSAGAWTVRDVAAHLLDGELRRISVMRDGHMPPPSEESIATYAALLRYLNGMNTEWVQAARRLSPHVLCDCLESAGAEVARLVAAADPWSDATFPVAWAGQGSSPMWLDIGREYTERWHHQDQIREAVGAPPLRQEQWLRPALEISLFALPYAYRSVSAAQGTALHLHVTGAAGGDWQLVSDSGWHIRTGGVPGAATTVTVADLDLTRLLLHRIASDRASSLLHVDGNPELAAPLLAARAVMV
jgi:uncharacterized protein (TIGR03083 family)